MIPHDSPARVVRDLHERRPGGASTSTVVTAPLVTTAVCGCRRCHRGDRVRHAPTTRLLSPSPPLSIALSDPSSGASSTTSRATSPNALRCGSLSPSTPPLSRPRGPGARAARSPHLGARGVAVVQLPSSPPPPPPHPARTMRRLAASGPPPWRPSPPLTPKAPPSPQP